LSREGRREGGREGGKEQSVVAFSWQRSKRGREGGREGGRGRREGVTFDGVLGKRVAGSSDEHGVTRGATHGGRDDGRAGGRERGREGGNEHEGAYLCENISSSLPPSTLSLHGREKLAIFFNGVKDGPGLLSTVHTESDL